MSLECCVVSGNEGRPSRAGVSAAKIGTGRRGTRVNQGFKRSRRKRRREGWGEEGE